MSKLVKEIENIIEIPVNSNLKMEIDYKFGRMRLDRKLETSMVYPGNYGYVPETLCGDGDALDTVMPVDYQIPTNTIVKSRIVGVFMMEDEAGQDEKLIVYPVSKVDDRFDHIQDLKDVPKSTLKKIEHFFKRYKDLSKGKFVKSKGFKGRDEAVKVLEDSIKMYKRKMGSKSKSVKKTKKKSKK